MSLTPVALPLVSHPNVACQSNGYTLNRERPENQPAKSHDLDAPLGDCSVVRQPH